MESSGSKLFIVGSDDDFLTVVEGYQLDSSQVFHDLDYEAALRDMLHNRHAGISAHLITVGSDPRDLLRLRPAQRRPSHDNAGELLDEYLRTRIPVRDEPLPERITWSLLETREPRLADLRAVVNAVVAIRSRGYDANAVWFSPRNVAGLPGLKYQMTRLVGWEALTDDPVLRSRDAYDVAYRMLYDSLPPDLEPDDTVE